MQRQETWRKKISMDLLMFCYLRGYGSSVSLCCTGSSIQSNISLILKSDIREDTFYLHPK